MSSFTTPLILSPNDDGQTWTLEEEFDYEIGTLSSGWRVRVPKGEITDFASIPRMLWDILPPWGRYGKPAILHDHLYKTQEFTRAFSDAVLREAMDSLGVPAWQNILIYVGVRVGGWVAWNQHARENAVAAAAAKQVADLKNKVVNPGE